MAAHPIDIACRALNPDGEDDPVTLIEQADGAGCFITVNGRWYFQDMGDDANAVISAAQLRILAAELDNRNGVTPTRSQLGRYGR